MIEVKIISDMPLPIPRSVMSSPSHMITAVPAVMMAIIVNVIWSESSGMIGSGQPCSSWPERASAMMPVDCRIASPIVR